jgi:hypothetical protein
MIGGRRSHAHRYTHRHVATRLLTSMTARRSVVTWTTQATLQNIGPTNAYNDQFATDLATARFIVKNSRLNMGIVGSNPTRGMMSVCVYFLFVLSCVDAVEKR